MLYEVSILSRGVGWGIRGVTAVDTGLGSTNAGMLDMVQVLYGLQVLDPSMTDGNGYLATAGHVL